MIPVAEAHPTFPPAPQPTETASVPSQPVAAPTPVVPVAEPTQAAETPPEGGSTAQTKQEEAARLETPAKANLNSAKAEAKLENEGAPKLENYNGRANIKLSGEEHFDYVESILEHVRGCDPN